MQVTVTKLRSNEGTVLVFEGTDPDGNTVTFAADHRPGAALVEALADAILQGEGIVDNENLPVADVPEWAILGQGWNRGPA